MVLDALSSSRSVSCLLCCGVRSVALTMQTMHLPSKACPDDHVFCHKLPADRLKKMAIKPANSGSTGGGAAAAAPAAAAARPGRQAAKTKRYSLDDSDEDDACEPVLQLAVTLSVLVLLALCCDAGMGQGCLITILPSKGCTSHL